MLSALKNLIGKTQPRFIIIAVFLAFFLWFFSLNAADPITFGNYTLNLQIRNDYVLAERNRLIMNERELLNYTVSVHVTGPKSQLDSLIRDETIVAFIDVNSAELVHVPTPGLNVPIPVRVNVSFAGALFDDLQITHVYPDTVDVLVDRIETRVLDTRVIFDPDDLPEGYIAFDAERDPLRVTIVGPSTVIGHISRSYVGVKVDVSNARADLIGVDVPIAAYSEFGDVITDFDINIDVMSFRLPIVRTQTAQILMGELIGEISEDYVLTDIEWEPGEVVLTGHVDEEHVDIVLDNIDITGITETTSINVNLNDFLERINEEHESEFALLYPAENMVRVTFVTEPRVTREFTVLRDNIAFSGELGRIEILDEYVMVTLRGIASVLDELYEHEVRIMVDAGVIAGYEDGEYTLDAEVILPPLTELYGEIPTVTIRLSTQSP